MLSLEKRTITGSFCIKLVNKKIKNNFEHVLYPLHIKSEKKKIILKKWKVAKRPQ